MKTHPAGAAETIMGPHNKRLKPAPTYEMETDPAILSRRQKQIDYGKSTPEYHNYCAAVPRAERQPHHPRTPNKHKKYSRRAWDGLVKQWRLNLHVWSDAPIPSSVELESMASMSGDEFNESFTSGGTEESCSTASSADVAFSMGFPKFAKGSSSKVTKIEREDDEISDEDSEDGENEEMDTSMNKTLTDETVKASSKVSSVSTKESKVKDRSSLSTSWGDEVNEYLDECERNYDNEEDLF